MLKKMKFAASAAWIFLLLLAGIKVGAGSSSFKFPVNVSEFTKADNNGRRKIDDAYDFIRDAHDPGPEITKWVKEYFRYEKQEVICAHLLAVAEKTTPSEPLDQNSVFQLLLNEAVNYVIPRPENVEIVCRLISARESEPFLPDESLLKLMQKLYVTREPESMKKFNNRARRHAEEFWLRNGGDSQLRKHLDSALEDANLNVATSNISAPPCNNVGDLQKFLNSALTSTDKSLKLAASLIFGMVAEYGVFKVLNSSSQKTQKALKTLNQAHDIACDNYTMFMAVKESLEQGSSCALSKDDSKYVTFTYNLICQGYDDTNSELHNLVEIMKKFNLANYMNCLTVKRAIATGARSIIFEDMLEAALNPYSAHIEIDYWLDKLSNNNTNLTYNQVMMLCRILARFRIFDLKKKAKSSLTECFVIPESKIFKDCSSTLASMIFAEIQTEFPYGWKSAKATDISKNNIRVWALQEMSKLNPKVIDADLGALLTQIPEIDYPPNSKKSSSLLSSLWSSLSSYSPNWFTPKPAARQKIENVTSALRFDTSEAKEKREEMAKKLRSEASRYANRSGSDIKESRNLLDKIARPDNYEFAFNMPISFANVGTLLCALLDEDKANQVKELLKCWYTSKHVAGNGLWNVTAQLQGTCYRRLLLPMMDLWVQNIEKVQPTKRSEIIYENLLEAARQEPSAMALMIAQRNRFNFLKHEFEFCLSLEQRQTIIKVLLETKDINMDLDTINYLLNTPITERYALLEKNLDALSSASKDNDVAVVIRTIHKPPKYKIVSIIHNLASIFRGPNYDAAYYKPLNEEQKKHFALMTRRFYDDDEALQLSNHILNLAANEQKSHIDDSGIDLWASVWTIQCNEDFASVELRMLIVSLARNGRSEQAYALLHAWTLCMNGNDEAAVAGNKWFDSLATLISLTKPELSEFSRVCTDAAIARIEQDVDAKVREQLVSCEKKRADMLRESYSEALSAACDELLASEVKLGMFWWFVNSPKVETVLTEATSTDLLRKLLNSKFLSKAPKAKAFVERGLAVLFHFKTPSLYKTFCVSKDTTVIALNLYRELKSSRTVGKAVLAFYNSYMSNYIHFRVWANYYCRNWFPYSEENRRFFEDEKNAADEKIRKEQEYRQRLLDRAKAREERGNAKWSPYSAFRFMYDHTLGSLLNTCSNYSNETRVLLSMDSTKLKEAAGEGRLYGLKYLYTEYGVKRIEGDLRLELLDIMVQAQHYKAAAECIRLLMSSIGNKGFKWTEEEKKMMVVDNLPIMHISIVLEGIYRAFEEASYKEQLAADKGSWFGTKKSSQGLITILTGLNVALERCLKPVLTVKNSERLGQLLNDLFGASASYTFVRIINVITKECPLVLSDLARVTLLNRMLHCEFLYLSLVPGFGDLYTFLFSKLAEPDRNKVLSTAASFGEVGENELRDFLWSEIPPGLIQELKKKKEAAEASNIKKKQQAVSEGDTDSEDSESGENSQKYAVKALLFDLIRLAKSSSKSTKRANSGQIVLNDEDSDDDIDDDSSNSSTDSSNNNATDGRALAYLKSWLKYFGTLPTLGWIGIGAIIFGIFGLIMIIVSLSSGWSASPAVATGISDDVPVANAVAISMVPSNAVSPVADVTSKPLDVTDDL